MQQQIEKIVEGNTYEELRNPSPVGEDNCKKCIAKDSLVLCEKLANRGCGRFSYFQIKDITKPHLTSEQKGIKTDTGKPRYGLIPPFALEQVAICLTEGLKTHPAKDNWKLVENAKERFLESLERHFQQYKMGEVFDRDNSKVRNLAAVIVNALFALEFEVNPELNKETK